MNDLHYNKNIEKAFIPVKQKCVSKTVWIMDNVSDYPITKKSLEELDKKIKKQMRRKKKKIQQTRKKGQTKI
jgi:GTPase involved in cell partitioning and DNA repair